MPRLFWFHLAKLKNKTVLLPPSNLMAYQNKIEYKNIPHLTSKNSQWVAYTQKGK